MATSKRLFCLLGLIFSGFLFSAPAWAECGGGQQCIAVSVNPLVPPAHGTPLTSAPLAFGNQTVATTSAARTIFVGAVTGPAGTSARLDAITLSGANAADFTSTGGTCTVDAPSLLQDGPTCTITVTFNPATLGPKTAQIDVSTAAITRTIPLTGTGTDALTRADPSSDPNVVGLVNAQAQTARRFSRAQIANFQRRMESLHRGPSPANAATSPGTGLSTGSTTINGPIMSRSAGASSDIGVGSIPSTAGVPANDHPGSTLFLRATNEPGGLRQTGPTGPGLGIRPTSFLTTLLSATTTRSANLSYSSDRADQSSGLPDGTGMWIGGNLHFGTRDQTSDSNSLRFSTDGISVGMDRRFSDKLALGMGLGYARDRTDIGTDGTKSRSHGSSLAVYGSYQPTRSTFVDGLIGYGMLSHDTDRYVALVNDFARGHRKGDQLFGSLAAGYEHRRDALLLSPYGRLDFAIDRLEQATETGAGTNALTYFDQTLQTLSFSLGLRAESKHDTNFGWALPRLRVEYRHDFKDDRQATVAYADQFAGPRYSVTPAGAKGDALIVGIGSDFVIRGGWKLAIDYQVERSSDSESSLAIRLWLSKELDGKGSPPGLSSYTLYENPVRVEAGYAWDDNLTRARDAADQLSDSIFSLNVSKSTSFPVTNHTRVLVNGFLGGDKLYTYSGLDRFSGGAHAEFQYRTSGEFDAPTFGIFGRASIDEYSSELRPGYRYSLGVTARQSLTDRIDVFGALAGNGRNADSVVFDTRDYSVRFNLDYSLGQRGTPYFSGEYRRGDTVSSGRQSADSIAIAEVFVPDDAYPNKQFIAYRYEARTLLWTLGYNWPLGPRDALDFSWRHARSNPTQAPNYALAAGYGSVTGVSSYTANQYSLVYLMRF